MNASTSTKFATGVTVGAVVVFVAAFIPWGLHPSPLVKAVPNIEGERPASGGRALVRINMPKTLTAWNTCVSVGALKLPNWVLILVAGALTALSWLKAFSIANAPAIVPLALAAYGLFHAGFVYVAQVWSRVSSRPLQGGAIEEGGALLTAVAFVAVLVVLVRQIRSPTPAGPA